MGDQDSNTLFTQTDVCAQQQGPALRRIMEEPWQLAKANERDKLVSVLTNFGFCMAKCSANRATDLISDFALYPNQSEIDSSFTEFRRFMRSRANLLIRGNRAWSSGRILLQLASETPESSIISSKCIAWLNASGEQRVWLRSHFRRQAQSNSIVLEGHGGNFDSFITIGLQDNTLLSRGTEYKVWDLNTVACIAEYPLDGRLLIISPRQAGPVDHPSTGPNGEIYLWAAKPSLIRFRRCEVEGYSMCNALEISNGGIVSLYDHKTIQVDQKKGVLILKGHTNAVIGFIELQDGSLLSWGVDGLLKVWLLANGADRTINVHNAPVLGAIQLTSGAIVSWDSTGKFIWSQIKDGNNSRLLGGVKRGNEMDYSKNLKEYTDNYVDESMWQRGTIPSDLRSAGAQEVSLNGKACLLTWANDLINWYDLGGALQHRQLTDNSEQLTGVIFLPGYGTARVYCDDSKIYLQSHSSFGEAINDGAIEIREPCARGIDGILLVDDLHFCTWSGRKRGDDSLRLWSAIDGDWSNGVRLEQSFEGHSRWIHTVNILSASCVVTCGEDDSIRVWDLDKDEQIVDVPVEGNIPTFIGDATWRISLHDYSSVSKKSLVLVDAITSKIRTFDEIQYGSTPPSVQASNGIAVIENIIAVNKDSKLTNFENFQEEYRKYWQSTVLCDGIILTIREIKGLEEFSEPPATLEENRNSVLFPQGGVITLWVCGFLDTQYWEASSIELPIPSLKIARISDFTFAVWGDKNEIEVYQIDLDDFGEREVFKSSGSIHNLSCFPSGLIRLDGSRLLVWAENAYLRIYDVDGAQLREEYYIDHLINVVQVSDKFCLACDSFGGIWEINFDNNQPKFLTNNNEKDVIGLVSLTNSLFLCISSQGILRLWDTDSLSESKVIFPGRYMSRAQFFWSLFSESEERGLAAGNPMKDAEGNTLMMLTFAPAAFSLMLFCKDTKSFYLLVIDEDRVKIWDASTPSEPICVWQFTQSSYRDPNLELGLSVDGQIAVLAGKNVQRLQLMRGTQPCRFDTIANIDC
jgi:WD40 repeat protein